MIKLDVKDFFLEGKHANLLQATFFQCTLKKEKIARDVAKMLWNSSSYVRRSWHQRKATTSVGKLPGEQDKV